MAPVATKDRILTWDLLRGFAVLGVLLANMPLMSMTWPWTFHVAWVGSDRAEDYFAFAFVRILADTKFVTIFSLLFGAGLGLMSEKALANGDRPFAGLYLKRLFFLFVFGALHAIFLWRGDVLVHYAMVGFVALWFRKVSVKTLVMMGSILSVLGILCWSLLAVGMHFKMAEAPGLAASNAETLEAIYLQFDYPRLLVYRAKEFITSTVFVTLIMGPRTLGLFFFGMALVKSRVLVDIAQHRLAWRRIAFFGLLLGLPLQFIWVNTSFRLAAYSDSAPMGLEVANSLLSAHAAYLLSPAYLAIIALWTLKPRWLGLRHRLAAVGRMALTNYISHSFITFWIFQFGEQWDRWGRFEGLALTFGIFVFQLWLSPWWLARYRFGPLEWVWRSLIYGQPQPFRLEAST